MTLVAERPAAHVNPEVLRWARESSGFALEAAATRIGVKAEKLAGAERGELLLTLRQAEKAANVYKRPFAALFLPTPPVEEPQEAQFRRLPGAPELPWSSEMRVLARRVRQRQDAAAELHELLEEEPAWPTASTGPEGREKLSPGGGPESARHQHRGADELARLGSLRCADLLRRIRPFRLSSSIRRMTRGHARLRLFTSSVTFACRSKAEVDDAIRRIRARGDRRKGSGGNPYRTQLGRCGPSFARLVFSALESQALTYPVASGLLGVKANNFGKFRHYLDERARLD
jgi:transcriptional regulator with XRE-family HTH domain